MFTDFRRSRRALWVAVCALLLKAAVPLLASTAAAARGVSVAQVCHVYGVALPSAAEHGEHHHHADDASQPTHDPSHPDAGRHDSHCALSALAALVPPALAAAIERPTEGAPAPVLAHRFAAPPDADAVWIARRKHGPPRRG